MGGLGPDSCSVALLSKWRPQRREDLHERALPDELVLYDPATDKAYLLNRSAAAVWDLCDGKIPAEAMVQDLASCFGRSLKEVRRDVQSILGRFQADSLLA
jgi:hypothetical protein